MTRQRAGVLIILGCACAAAAAMAVFWADGAPGPVRQMPRSHRLATGIVPNAALAMAGPTFAEFPGNAEPRTVATMACRAGPFVVSVRGIRPVFAGGPGRGAGNASLGPFALGIQVLAAGGITSLSLPTESVRLKDSSGKWLQALPDQAACFPISGGGIYQQAFEAPAEGARLFKVLEGCIVRSSDGRRYPFRISDIPLPSLQSVFGRCVPRELPDGGSLPVSPGLAIVTGAAADKLISRSRPASVQPGVVPEHLVLGVGIPARLDAPEPGGPQHLRLKVGVSSLGKFSLYVALDGRIAAATVWDGDPFAVTLPAAAGRHTALIMRLTRDLAPVPAAEGAPSPFPAGQGQPGGALRTSVAVGARPFGNGTLLVALWRKSGDGWEGPRSIYVPVQRDGSAVVPNLEPGVYRVDRSASGLTPTPPVRGATLRLDAYLWDRFHARGGKWRGEVVSDISVRPGQQTDMPVLEYEETRSPGGRSARMEGAGESR